VGDLNLMVRQFQNVTLAIKHAPRKPVVGSPPQGLALAAAANRSARYAQFTPLRKPTWASSKPE